MRTKEQKPKPYSSKKRIDKWEGYYLADIECKNCQHWKGKKRGCSLTGCNFEFEKQDVKKSGRFFRKRGST